MSDTFVLWQGFRAVSNEGDVSIFQSGRKVPTLMNALMGWTSVVDEMKDMLNQFCVWRQYVPLLGSPKCLKIDFICH